MSNIDKQRENGVVRIVHGRSCKSCTLYCKVLAISELEKPRATWCRHCDVKTGCEIYVRCIASRFCFRRCGVDQIARGKTGN
jgi:hypothetical protein